jgi:signal transduction histidine kinase
VRGMQERAAALGGSCEAGTVNGAGWRVRARIPLDGNRS